MTAKCHYFSGLCIPKYKKLLICKFLISVSVAVFVKYNMGDITFRTINSVKIGRVTIEKFYGFYNDGHVFGFGVNYIDFAR